MDVVCLSSDSENSTQADCQKIQTLDNDVFIVDWNDEVYFPLDFSDQGTSQEIEPVRCRENKGNSPMLLQKQIQSSPIDELNRSNKDLFANSVYDINDDSSTTEEDNNLKNKFKSKMDEECVNLPLEKSPVKKRKRNKLSQEEKEMAKVLKEQKKIEREKLREEKKAEQSRQKAFKAVISENQRSLKPEENIKFLKVHIDNELINSVFGGNIISVLQKNNIQYVVENQIKSGTVTWTKRRVLKDLDEKGELMERSEYSEEKQLLYVMDWKKTVNLIHGGDFLSHIETIRTAYIEKKLTIIIYGLEKYFEFWKKKKNDSKGKYIKLTETEKLYKEAPKVTEDELEFALVDLQLFGKHNHRLLENPEDLSGLIFNITKSLSQIDFKLDKQRRQEEDLDWFAKGDSCQTVKVDKNGNGLINLWQQQICQFSNVGIDTAQAVVAQYKSPVALINAYKQCKNLNESELLLQNIQIRRDIGLLSSSRRLGPQLSKKIHKFFTSDDPNEEL